MFKIADTIRVWFAVLYAPNKVLEYSRTTELKPLLFSLAFSTFLVILYHFYTWSKIIEVEPLISVFEAIFWQGLFLTIGIVLSFILFIIWHIVGKKTNFIHTLNVMGYAVSVSVLIFAFFYLTNELPDLLKIGMFLPAIIFPAYIFFIAKDLYKMSFLQSVLLFLFNLLLLLVLFPIIVITLFFGRLL